MSATRIAHQNINLLNFDSINASNMQKGCIWWRERKKKRERVKDRERSQTKLDKQWKKIEALMRNSIGRCNAKSEFISKFYRNALEWTFARLQGKKMPLWRIYLHLFSELCVCFGSEVFSNSLATQMQLSRQCNRWLAFFSWLHTISCRYRQPEHISAKQRRIYHRCYPLHWLPFDIIFCWTQ